MKIDENLVTRRDVTVPVADTSESDTRRSSSSTIVTDEN